MIRRLPALFLAALFLAACARAPEPDLPPTADRGAYLKTFEDWTREGMFYDKAEKLMRAGATLESPAYAEARDKYLFNLFRDESVLSLYSPPDKGRVSFYFACYIPEFNEDDLTEKHAVWKVYLQQDGGPLIEPEKLVKLKEPRAVKMALYPYVSDWTVQYHIIFPVKFDGAEDGAEGSPAYPSGELVLLLTGPRGRVFLTWDKMNDWGRLTGWERPVPKTAVK